MLGSVADECRAQTISADSQKTADQILQATGITGGLVVHVGCGDGKLTAALRAGDGFLVHGLDTDEANVQAAREHLESLGINGPVSVDHLASNRLPYIDNLVNLLVVEDPGAISGDELMRVLCPNGIAYIKQNGTWIKKVKPRPAEIDEWTHYMHDPSGNAVAHDTVIGPPRRLQWQGGPRWSRHHDNMSSVSALVTSGGRVFYIFDEGPHASIELPSKWTLIARDAFNGTILWKRPIDSWHVRLWPLKSGPAELPRRLVAVGDTVYTTLGLDAPLVALDAATGETIQTYKGTASTEEIIATDGALFLVVEKNPAGRTTLRTMGSSLDEIKRLHTETSWGEAQREVVAVDAESGRPLWQHPTKVLPLTLAADGQAVYFHNGEKVVSLDRKSGRVRWSSEPVARRQKIISEYAPTLVVYEDVVLFSGGSPGGGKGGSGGVDAISALDTTTGKTLWSAEHPPSGYRSPEDILVTGGLVWSAATTSGALSGVFTGRDPRTGEVKSEFPPDVDTYWFHHRCYRGKATDKYLLMSRTGIEFVDYEKQQWLIHHWVRGACLYGIMPANGLIYAPQHPCACYPEAKQYGFSVLAPESNQSLQLRAEAEKAPRLQRGPAYSSPANPSSLIPNPSTADWPTYRGNVARSGATEAAVPVKLDRSWQTELGGKLSAVTVAGGRLFVAQVDAHTVHALDAASGEQLWSYTAGGRVDSPPTAWQGRVLFGSADGWVYCLTAADGRLIWRFRAAPVDQRTMAFEQVESVWPVHGSVLVLDGVVQFAAGRSMFLDGGMRMLRLDAKTGRKISETVLDDRDPETGESLQVRLQTLQMPVAQPDILSSDGTRVFMKSQVFDLEGNRRDLGPNSGEPSGQGSVQGGQLAHVFCPSGFLDDTWWHRTYWVYGRSFAGGHAGYYQAGRFAPSGRILVFDDDTVYGFGRKPEYYRWTTPLEHHLFAASKQSLDTPKKPGAGKGPQGGSIILVEKSASLDPADKPLTVTAWAKAEGRDGVIVARGGPAAGYALLVRGSVPQFIVRSADELHSVDAERKVKPGTWVHLAGVLTADKKLLVYVDGQLAGTAEAAGLIDTEPKQPMGIGAEDAGPVGDYKGPFSFKGSLDEIRIYHRALEAGEIASHAAASKPPAAGDDLALYYTFDSGKPTDASGNDNHGTPNATEQVDGKFGAALKFTGTVKKTNSSAGEFFVNHRWTEDLPLWVRAMVLADGKLFVAGPPDLVDEEDAAERFGEAEVQELLAQQGAALEGAKGAMLRVVSAADGSKLAESRLDSLPVFDGMAAAGGKLYIATTDGKVVCLAGK